MSTYYDMMQDVLSVSKKHNIQVNSISRIGLGKEYIISLTYKEDAHDGTVCQKLPIEESVPFVAVGKGVGCVTDPAIIKVELDGGKLETVESKDDGVKAVDVKSFMDLGQGDHVLYYGQAHKDRHGEKAAVKEAYKDDNIVIRFLKDDVVVSASAKKLKKVVY